MKLDILIKIGSGKSLIIGFEGCWYAIFYDMFHDHLIFMIGMPISWKMVFIPKQSQSLSAVLSELNSWELTIRAIVAQQYIS